MQSLAQVAQHREEGAIKPQNLQDMGEGDGARKGVKIRGCHKGDWSPSEMRPHSKIARKAAHEHREAVGWI